MLPRHGVGPGAGCMHSGFCTPRHSNPHLRWGQMLVERHVTNRARRANTLVEASPSQTWGRAWFSMRRPQAAALSDVDAVSLACLACIWMLHSGPGCGPRRPWLALSLSQMLRLLTWRLLALRHSGLRAWTPTIPGLGLCWCLKR